MNEATANAPSGRAAGVSEGANDQVNSPHHYIGNGLEAIQVIEDWGLGFNLANAFKCIVRAQKKGRMVEDCQKAIWYLERGRRDYNLRRLAWRDAANAQGMTKIGVRDVAVAFSLKGDLASAVLHIWRAADCGRIGNLQVADQQLVGAGDALMRWIRPGG